MADFHGTQHDHMCCASENIARSSKEMFHDPEPEKVKSVGRCEADMTLLDLKHLENKLKNVKD